MKELKQQGGWKQANCRQARGAASGDVSSAAIGGPSPWKRLAWDDSTSDAAQEERREAAPSQTVSRRSKIGLLFLPPDGNQMSHGG